jgi:hypothetical protein
MKGGASGTECPPAVSATEGRSTALVAGANPTYGSNPGTGKRLSRLPDNTGNNSAAEAFPGGAGGGRGEGGNEPPVSDEERFWTLNKRGGEVRMSLNLYKGKRILNLRWWAETRKGLIPTKEGVTIPQDAIEDFERAVRAVSAAVRSIGA